MQKTDISNASVLRTDILTSARQDGPDHPRPTGPTLSRVSGGDLRDIAGGDDGSVQTPARPNSVEGSLSGGRRSASGSGGAHGSPIRPARGDGLGGGPDFRVSVDAGGYAWWYIDGISADGTRAVSVIGFIGSVFSPWYGWSGRHDPANHCCINVVTSGLTGRFTMTDRGRQALRQTRDRFEVGPSSLNWTGKELIIDINEWGALPLALPLRGQIVLTPAAVTQSEVALTPDARHIWRPFAPIAHISVDFGPTNRWEGHGYFDANHGTRPLESDFHAWTWGRFPLKERTVCFYDALRRSGDKLALGVEIDRDGQLREIAPPPLTPMPRTIWALKRESRADIGTRPQQKLSLLEAPFYSRAVVETQIDGEKSLGMHEALDLKRFRFPLLKPMLAVRVPRRAKWPKAAG